VVNDGRHPKNAINAALSGLDPAKFRVVEIHNGHTWGRVICLTCNAYESIWSTPRVPENNAKAIARFVAKHQH